MGFDFFQYIIFLYIRSYIIVMKLKIKNLSPFKSHFQISRESHDFQDSWSFSEHRW